MAIRPAKDGVIADFDVTQRMLKYFINKSMNNKGFLVKSRVVVSVPSGVTAVEERAVREELYRQVPKRPTWWRNLWPQL